MSRPAGRRGGRSPPVGRPAVVPPRPPCPSRWGGLRPPKEEAPRLRATSLRLLAAALLPALGLAALGAVLAPVDQEQAPADLQAGKRPAHQQPERQLAFDREAREDRDAEPGGDRLLDRLRVPRLHRNRGRDPGDTEQASRLLTIVALAGLGLDVDVRSVRSVGARVAMVVAGLLIVLVLLSLGAIRVLRLNG